MDTDDSTEDWTEIASRTFKYSAVCSSGFFVALGISLLIYFIMRRSSSKESDPLLWFDLGSAEVVDPPEEANGRFGKFMICVEMLDAIPEAAIIADAVVNGTVSLSFVLAIFCLNVCNGLATSMDFLAKNRDTNRSNCHESICKCLFVFIFFAVGVLSYSISADIYANFATKYDGNLRDGNHFMLLLGGTVMGGVLIATLLRVEDWLHHKSDAAGEVGPKPTFNRRVWQCTLIFFAIAMWTCFLSYGLSAIFWLFVEHSSSAYIEAALEGLSGGAFLATVAGTMIPRMQQDAMSIRWTEVRKKLVGVLLFEMGIMSGVAIDVLL
jgi:hypothetical protein